MGFFKDISTLSKQGKELSRNTDVRAQMAGGLATMQAANDMLRQQTANAHLVTEGLDAVATVTGVRQTGAYLNLAPVVQIDLLVMHGAPVPVTHQEAVPPIHLARLQLGASLRVKIDPADARRVWIDWYQLG